MKILDFGLEMQQRERQRQSENPLYSSHIYDYYSHQPGGARPYVIMYIKNKQKYQQLLKLA